ncbi:DNA repair protein RecO [Methylobacter sp. BlB1]|uniref:DNA repair protein RecO n=1 Tax=Methylobacter sp. BlB1 TaxID=2785914 RepID=UPI0018942758|nr:DNA repair protein RecO [Methylobacter sp. BlB1]MBF6648966.1 DNA repair protein RecO [Methylobacter sp. BlB1]
MTEPAVYLQPAFILQHRKYRETSLIIDVLTRDFGRLSLVAKGVKKSKSKTAGTLQPFIPLLISYVGKAELKTLTDVEIALPFVQLGGLAFYCGFYVNELISRFLHKYDPHPEVFNDYASCLSRLADGDNIEATLRSFELKLMDHVGYGLQLEHDVNGALVSPLKHYAFDAQQGAVEAADGRFSGKTLLAIKSKEFDDPHVLSEAKILMRAVIDSHLQGKPLKSRTVINKISGILKNE